MSKDKFYEQDQYARAAIPTYPVLDIDRKAKVINIPAGCWRVTEPIVLSGQVLAGAGRDITNLYPVYSGNRSTIVVRSNSDQTRNMKGTHNDRTGMGTCVRDLTIASVNYESSAGIYVDGTPVCDNITIQNVACRNLITGFTFVGAVRESSIINCIAINCIDGYIIQSSIVSGLDNCNNLKFFMCDSVYNWNPIKVINYRKDRVPIRSIQWIGGLIHARISEPCPSLIAIDGDVWGVTIQAHFVGPGPSSPLVTITNPTQKSGGINISGTWVPHGTVIPSTGVSLVNLVSY